MVGKFSVCKKLIVFSISRKDYERDTIEAIGLY
jgi:hypothetical protein